MSELFPAEVLAEIEKNSPEPLAFERHFNGARLEQNKTLCDALIGGVAIGMPAQQLARLFNVSRNSIGALVERAEKDGRLQSAEARQRSKLVMLLEDTLDHLLQSGKPLSVLEYGILFDKVRLIDGQPTTIGAEVKSETVDETVARLKKACEGVIDVEEVK